MSGELEVYWIGINPYSVNV